MELEAIDRLSDERTSPAQGASNNWDEHDTLGTTVFVPSTNFGECSYLVSEDLEITVGWCDASGDWATHLLMGDLELASNSSIEDTEDLIDRLLHSLNSARQAIAHMRNIPVATKSYPAAEPHDVTEAHNPSDYF